MTRASAKSPFAPAFWLAASVVFAACSGGSDAGPDAQPLCGDGLVQTGEECDDGNAIPSDGCENDCRFTCVAGNPERSCPPPSACATAVCDGASHTCSPGPDQPDGFGCGSGLICLGGGCVASACGDGYVDAGAGEQCDPPDGTTCDASCRQIRCGDGVLSSTEQCDDTNGTPHNLDGCDTSCRYETFLRINSFALSSAAAPAGCTPTTNRLGRQSLTGTALSNVNPMIQDEVDSGIVNTLVQPLGLDDLTGAADSSLQIGLVGGQPDPARGTWPGDTVDWWFLVNAQDLDAADLPLTLLDASIAARQLTAGPADATLALSLGGAPVPLRVRSARVFATIDATPAPDVPAPPPTLLAAGVTVFRTVTASGTGQGLCGNVTVESLAQIPVPQSLAMGGATACGSCAGSKSYAYCGAGQPVGPNCNSFLDVLVGGCKVTACFVTVVNAQQPDVPAVTGGTVTSLTLGAGNKVPDALTTGNEDAYSSFFTFTADRVHATGKTP